MKLRRTYSLRFLLIITALAAIAVLVYQRHTAHNAVVKQLQDSGATITFHTSPLLVRPFGDFFANVREVDMASGKWSPVAEDDLKLLRYFPYLERLDLSDTTVNDAGVKNVADLFPSIQLTELSLRECIFVSAVRDLERMEQLKVLDISGTNISGNRLRFVENLKQLEQVTFTSNDDASDCETTKEDLAALSRVRAIPVGKQHLRNIGDASLLKFLSMDLSQSTELTINSGHLTQVGTSSLAEQSFRKRETRSGALDEQRYERIQTE